MLHGRRNKRNFASMKSVRIISSFVIVVIVLSALSSCSSSRHISREDWYENYDDYGRPLPDRKKKRHDSRKDKNRKWKGGSATGDARKVIDMAHDWLGAPYQYGGNSRAGIDCSGLTCVVFEQAAGIKLPRSSSDQADWCRRISQRDLRPGDLIFFVNKPGGNRINHVGLYVGDGMMIHSSTSRGVTVTSLDDAYWSARLHRCGRVHGLE